MNKKVIAAAIAGAITTFMLGWLIYGMLLMDFMEANTVKYEGLMLNPQNLGCCLLRIWFMHCCLPGF
ncbi:MAG: hypothetical protein IPJ79_16525 [Bacteroidetes bacterium]|nr:hypothetical protein [Bacteroidota bacterium]